MDNEYGLLFQGLASLLPPERSPSGTPLLGFAGQSLSKLLLKVLGLSHTSTPL